MLAFHSALEPLFHIEGYITTLLNGAVQDFSMSYHYPSHIKSNVER
jgi:hypothetical protein